MPQNAPQNQLKSFVPDSPATPKSFVPDGGAPLAAPRIPQSATISAVQPTLFSRAKAMFTEGIPELSSRTVYDPKYGQQQLLSPESALSPDEQAKHPILTGAGEVAGSLTTGSNIALIGGAGALGGVAPMLSKLLSIGFAAQMGAGTLDAGKQALAAYKSGNISEAERLATHALLSAGLTAAAASHGFTGETSALPKDRPPTTAPQKAAMSDALGNFIDTLPRPKSFVPDEPGPVNVASPKVGQPSPVKPGFKARADAALSKVGLTLEPTWPKPIEAAIKDMQDDLAKPFEVTAGRGRSTEPLPPSQEPQTVTAPVLPDQKVEETPESTQVSEPLGPQPTQLKPGEELPRPLGATIKSQLPPRTPVPEPTEAQDATAEPQPPLTYGTVEQSLKSAPTRKFESKAPADPGKLPTELTDVMNKLQQNRRRQSLPGRAETALTGDKSEATYLTQQLGELVDQYGRGLKTKASEAAGNLRAQSESLNDHIAYLEKRDVPGMRDKVNEFQQKIAELNRPGTEAERPHALRMGFGGQLIVDEAGKPQVEEGSPHAFREATAALLGNRRAEVLDIAGAKAEMQPSEPLPEHIQNAKDELEEAKESIKQGLVPVEHLDDFRDNMKTLEKLVSEYERPRVKTHGRPTKEQVAQAKGVPASTIDSTGAGKAASIKDLGALPVMTKKIWQELGGSAERLPTPEQERAKLDELKLKKAQLDFMSKALDDWQLKWERQRGAVGDLPEKEEKNLQDMQARAEANGNIQAAESVFRNEWPETADDAFSKLRRTILGYGVSMNKHIFAYSDALDAYGEKRDTLERETEGLTEQTKHEQALQAGMEVIAKHADGKIEAGISGARLLGGIATGGVTGAIAGGSVAGPVGGLVGSAIGMAAGGVTSAFDLKTTFPTVYDRLRDFGRGASPDERMTDGLITKSIVRRRTGEEAQRQAQLKFETKELNQRIDKQWTAKQGLDYMVKAAHGTFPLNQAEQTLYSVIESGYEPRREAIENLTHGAYDNWKENYFAGIYKKPGAVKDWLQRQLGAKRPIAGSGAFRRHKVFEDVSEAIAAGFEPVTTNPLALSMLKMHEMDKYITGHRILADMKEEGVAQFFKSAQDAPKGWRKFDDPISKVVSRNAAGERVIRGDYYGPPDAVRVFDSYVKPGLSGIASPGVMTGVNIVRAIGNAENQFQLGFSAFHMMGTSINAIASDAARSLTQLREGELWDATKSAARASSMIGSIRKTYLDGEKVVSEYLSPGKMPAYRASVDAIKTAGGRVGMDEQYSSKSRTAFWDAKKEGRYVAMAAHAPFAGIELLASPIMERIVPTMKVGIFHGMASDILLRARNHNWTDAQITRAMDRAWDSIDNRFGQVVYNNIFVPKIAKDIAFLAVRSAGWTGGTIRELGGAGLDVARLGARALTAEPGDKLPELSPRVAFAIGLTAATAYIGGLYTWGHTGHLPTSAKNYWQLETGRVGADGRKEYTNLPSYMKDVFAYEYNLGSTILNKTHPLLHTMAELYQNKDYYGVEIVHPDDPLHNRIADYVKFVAKQFLPFSWTNAEHRLKGGTESIVESAFGVTPAPRYATMSPAERTLYNDASQNYSGVRTHEAYERSQLRSNLEEAFRTHDVPTRKSLIEQGYANGMLAPADLDKIIEDSKVPYFDSAVKRGRLEDLVKLYASDKPDKVERKKLQQGILEKFDQLDDKPKQERDEILQLYKQGRAKHD